MCLSEVTRLPVDGCIIAPAIKNITRHVCIVQSGYHHHIIKCTLFSPLYSCAHFGVQKQSLIQSKHLCFFHLATLLIC
jgi:hypothetical protein